MGGGRSEGANPGPLVPETSALPSCATARMNGTDSVDDSSIVRTHVQPVKTLWRVAEKRIDCLEDAGREFPSGADFGG